MVGNSLSLTLDKIDNVKRYIRIKTHNPIVLKFLVKSGVKCLGY